MRAREFTKPVAASLVLDGVTVIDVEHGTRLPDQRVLIVGNRIRAVGPARALKIPAGARLVDAREKYLIPGLWDMHVHPYRAQAVVEPMLVANGITGIRNAGSGVPLDTLQLWRREILAGTRIGPPRQILSGQSMAGPRAGCERRKLTDSQSCVTDSADVVHYVDSLHALGVDMIKLRDISKDLYRVAAAEAKRLHIPFGGHAEGSHYEDPLKVRGKTHTITALQASNYGASIVDHELGEWGCWKRQGYGQWDSATYQNSRARCQADADRFRLNGTWFVPTLGHNDIHKVAANTVNSRFSKHLDAIWRGILPHGNWLRDSLPPGMPGAFESGAAPAAIGAMTMAQATKLPLLAGTDAMAVDPYLAAFPPGFSLHAELAMYVAEGLTPLNALQSATLNPARFLHATESLGTVTPGKLADLVLLDADPLTDITNTTTIRAVVANGRYFDRDALDRLLAEARAAAPAFDPGANREQSH